MKSTSLLAVLALSAACAPAAPAQPTAAPAKPAEGGAAAVKPAAAPTAAPAAAKPTEAPKPVEAAKPTAAPAAAKTAPGRMGGIGRVALYSEPPTLDSTWTTAIIVVVPAQHVFEYLFAWDGKWDAKPFLASGFEVSNGGLTYTISLRKGVKFHNGKTMTAEDVVASLDRWGKLSGEGKLTYKSLAAVTAVNDSTVKLDLKESFAPLIAYLTGPSGAGAIIMPKEIADKAGIERLTEYVGTGPYKFVEHIPDRHIRVARYEGYAAREEPPDAYAGRRTAYFDEIQFITVPDAAARIAGVETGNYHWAEEVTRDEHARLSGSRDLDTIVIKPLRWKTIVFNKKQGPLAEARLRQAALYGVDCQEVMAAAFGPPDFWRLDQSLLPPESVWYSEAAKDQYNTKNVDRARQLIRESGYNGDKIRWIAPADREDYFAAAVTGVQQLKSLGLNVELVSMDWGSLVKQRTEPDKWEIFNTGTGFLPEPTQLGFIPDNWPGWWVSQEKEAQLGELIKETDPQKRKALWDKFQQLVYQEVPVVKVGEFFGLTVKRKELKGESIPIGSWPSFWNQWLEK